MQASSRLRSWPVIVGALIAVFGIGVGVGVAFTHGRTSATLSPAQVADQRRIGAQQVVEQQRNLAKRNQQLAVREEELAVRQARLAEQRGQELAWMNVCDTMYPVPPKVTDPERAHDSALLASCIAAVRKGISPETFRRNNGA